MMHNDACQCGSGSCGSCGSNPWHACKSWALLVLRIAAGIIFIYHGYGKLFGGAPGMEAFTGMVAKIGFPLPMLFAYAAALSEFVGGIMILLGVFTQYAAIFTAIVMFVALVFVKKFNLPAADPDIALLAISIALALMGGGKFSLWRKKHACCQEEAKPTSQGNK
jgi:putative oxidoreductase